MLGDSYKMLSGKAGMVSPIKSTARCRLFGEVDNKSLNEMFEREMAANLAASRTRWDYDFQKDCPVPGGKYNWAPVDQQKEYIPGPYLTTYKHKAKAPRRRPAAPYARKESVKRKITFEGKPSSTMFADENVSPLALVTDSAANSSNSGNTVTQFTQSATLSKHLRQTTLTGKQNIPCLKSSLYVSLSS